MECSDFIEGLNIPLGYCLGKKHTVCKYLGEGGFGVVAKCYNREKKINEAIKICMGHPTVIRQAKLEVAMLKRLRCLNPDTCNIIRWNEFFFHEEMICLNFELLDLSLRDYLIDTEYEPFTMSELRPIIHQIATALSYLSLMGIVHADIKPENIMIINCKESPMRVKVIDFGLAHPALSLKTGCPVQTIFYRAPEVMLHSPFHEAIDVWSLGATAAELATGCVLYPGNTNYDMLRFFIAAQGQPADHVLERGKVTDCYFLHVETDKRRWLLKSCEQFQMETGYCAKETRQIFVEGLDQLQEAMEPKENEAEHRQLVDLIKKMLDWDCETRIKAKDILNHQFITKKPPKSSPAGEPKDKQQASSDQVPDVKVDISAASFLEGESDKRPEDVPQKPKSKNGGLFRAAFSETCRCLFPCLKK